MRHSATRSLLERRDVIVVASVCASHLEAEALADSRFIRVKCKPLENTETRPSSTSSAGEDRYADVVTLPLALSSRVSSKTKAGKEAFPFVAFVWVVREYPTGGNGARSFTRESIRFKRCGVSRLLFVTESHQEASVCALTTFFQVSCIYGLGMPSKYLEASIRVVRGQEWVGGWSALTQHLEQVYYRAS